MLCISSVARSPFSSVRSILNRRILQRRRFHSGEKVQTVRLNDGNIMPVLGLGTWQADPGQVENAVQHAIRIGYRLIDCAAVYRNEKEVGKGLKQGMESAGLSRKDLFITSKLWNTEHRPERVQAACENTLKDLGLDYLDLYLIHWPVAFEPATGSTHPRRADGSFGIENVPLLDTWKAMQNLVKKGMVKSIGVSNFSQKHFGELLAGTSIIPAVNQIELHPYLCQKELTTFCKQLNVTVESYSPLGRGLEQKAGAPVLLNDPKVLDIAAVHKCTPAQLILRWHIQSGFVTIPKSVTPKRIEENWEVWHFTLTESEMAMLDGLNQGKRYVSPNWFSFEEK